MKEVKAPFRLYDFLAYLFPGFTTLHLILIWNSPTISMLNIFITNNSIFNYIMLIVFAYLIGQFWSVFNREIIRRLLWKIKNPRIDFYNFQNAGSSPFAKSTTELFQEKAKALFCSEELVAESVYFLCRTYVAQNCPTSWSRREVVSTLRSMCGNLIGPVVMYAIFFLSQGFTWWGILTLIGVIVLAKKYINCDIIEWKEIYSAFLNHQLSKLDKNNLKEYSE